LKNRRYVAHVDMDAFFASIEERDRPCLRGKPIVVGADPKRGRGRGVVSTCSYAAREFGIHSAMPISTAYRKCPDAVFLPVDMEKYAAVSHEIYEILYSFSPDIEPISIDEAFLDITGSYRLFGRSPIAACRAIKAKILEFTGLTASVGLAPTMMAAKIASDISKPDGLIEVPEEGLLDFLWPLEVRKIWGLGRKSEEELAKTGVRTVGDLARKSPEELVRVFGKNGLGFWKLANGIDERRVMPQGEAKSVSNEATFEEDTRDRVRIESALVLLAEKVSRRLRAMDLKARTITLKVRLEGFKTFTRGVSLGGATNFVDVIYSNIKNLFEKFDPKSKAVRLVGVRASSLSPALAPDSLFRDSADEKCEAKHKALDSIKDKFGDDSIFFAGSGPRAKKEYA